MYNLRNTRQRKSTRRYVSKRMKESLVTGVPEIVRSETRSRRALKSIVFLCCTIGFFYQTYTFLESFYKYETIKNVRIEFPIQFMGPAVTLCYKNRINRVLFCNAFPEECLSYETREEFCNAAPNLCKLTSAGSKCFAVLRKTSTKHLNLSNEFLDAYGTQSAWNNRYVKMNWSARRYGNLRRYKDNDSIIIQVPSGGLPYKCLSIYSLLGKPNQEPINRTILDDYYFPVSMFQLLLMNDKDNSQIYISIHDPRRSVNPIAEGITLTAGYRYTLSINMQQIKNLPPPYNTNCKDYMKEWKENGGRGPLTKKDCIELCKIERMMEQHKCVGKSITYPHRLPICSKIITISDKVVTECSSGCREACDLTLYTIAGKHEVKRRSTNPENYIVIRLIFEGLSLQRIFMEPKFQDIELFSYIGGFIGIWLGISLVTFVDFLETVSDVITFAVMKWKKALGKKSIRRRFRY